KANLEFVSKPAALPMAFLSPDEYVEARVRDQIAFFSDRTSKLSAQLRRMQTYIYIAGGTATFIAAILPNYGVWVALATAFVTAFTSKLQSEQVENSLVQYNQTLASLRNINIWWKSLT